MSVGNKFNFGFIHADDDELSRLIQKPKTEEPLHDEQCQRKVSELFQLITHLLEELSKDPSKDYIYWPGRIQKLAEFKTHLEQIIRD